MSSTLTVTNLTATNLTDGAGTTSTFANVVDGSSKAWMSLTGTGTISVDDSLNISSASDVGTGRYTQNYSSAFSSGTKSLVMSGGYWTFNAEIDAVPTSSADTFQCKDVASSGAPARDADVINTSACGDLA